VIVGFTTSAEAKLGSETAGHLDIYCIQPSYQTGLTKPDKVGNFFALVLLKSPYSQQKAKSSCQSLYKNVSQYFFSNNHAFYSIFK